MQPNGECNFENNSLKDIINLISFSLLLSFAGKTRFSHIVKLEKLKEKLSLTIFNSQVATRNIAERRREVIHITIHELQKLPGKLQNSSTFCCEELLSNLRRAFWEKLGELLSLVALDTNTIYRSVTTVLFKRAQSYLL